MTETPTSYSLLVMFRDVIYAIRDPYGNRPLCIGRIVPISKLQSSGEALQVFLFLPREVWHCSYDGQIAIPMWERLVSHYKHCCASSEEATRRP